MKRITRFVICTTLIASFVLGCAERASLSAADLLLQNVPKQAQTVIYLDVEKIIKLPAVKEMRESEEDFGKDYKEFNDKLKAQGIEPEKLIKKAVIYVVGKDSAGVLATTDVTEEKAEELLNSGIITSEKTKISKEKMDGKNVFVVTQKILPTATIPGMPVPSASPEKTIITFLKPGLVFMTDQKSFGKLIKLMKEGNVTENKDVMARKAGIDSNAPLWAVFEIPPTDNSQKSQPSMMGNPLQNMSGGSVSVSFSGPQEKDVDLDAVFECKDAATAQQTTMQIQGFVMMFSGMLFKDNPQLGVELGNSLKLNADGKNMKAKFKLTKDLQDKLKAYANQPKPVAGIPGGNTQMGTPKPPKGMK